MGDYLKLKNTMIKTRAKRWKNFSRVACDGINRGVLPVTEVNVAEEYTSSTNIFLGVTNRRYRLQVPKAR